MTSHAPTPRLRSMSSSGAHRCPAVSASPAALELVAAAAVAPARIHSVFRSAVNVETAAGLLTLATPATGGIPNGVLLALDDLRSLDLRPGLAVTATGAELSVPARGLVIDLAGAARWSPRFPRTRAHPSDAVARWRSRADHAWHVARRLAPRGGLRPLLWPDTTAPRDRIRVDDFAATWTARARWQLDVLADGLTRRDRSGAALAAGGLVGLGDGATPSGDDALVGMEAALHAIGDPLAGFSGAALDDVEERTTIVAATFLRAAARGEFAERMHHLVLALLGPDEDATARAIERAVAWGATSGTDGLVGVLRALDAVAGRTGALERSA